MNKKIEICFYGHLFRLLLGREEMGKGVCYFIRVTNDHSQRKNRSLRADANSLLHVKRHDRQNTRLSCAFCSKVGFGCSNHAHKQSRSIMECLYSRVDKLGPFFPNNGQQMIYAFHGISYGIPPICLTFSQRVIIISKLQIRIKF